MSSNIRRAAKVTPAVVRVATPMSSSANADDLPSASTAETCLGRSAKQTCVASPYSTRHKDHFLVSRPLLPLTLTLSPKPGEGIADVAAVLPSPRSGGEKVAGRPDEGQIRRLSCYCGFAYVSPA